MDILGKYIEFCNKLHEFNLPKIKFKLLSERYKHIYKSNYNIETEDVNKLNFIIFVISFVFIAIILYSFTNYNLILILGVSTITSLFLSHHANSIVYKRIKVEEKQLNAAIYLIKIYFSLIQSSLPSNADYIIHFINMIKDYNLSISQKFKKVINLIQLGEKPEYQLSLLITPSKEMNLYINQLLTLDFQPKILIDNFAEKALEKNFSIFLKQIDSKLSMIFFISLFLPIALSILIIFREILLIYILPILIVYYFLLMSLNRKFLKEDFFLLGILKDYSKQEKERFDQFLSFLGNFALNLRKNFSPELAFINSYSAIKSKFEVLRLNFEKKISRLLTLSISFEEFITEINLDLNSPRFKIILNILVRLLAINSYFSNEKILEILKIISKHQKLQRKFETILKGEKFKVLLYIILLPIIVGGIGGLFPIFNLMLGDLTEIIDKIDYLLKIDCLIIYIALLISVIISANLYVNILKFKRKMIIILCSWLLFSISFFWALLSVINLYLF